MLHLGINLIFAIEGEAPDLKHETMSRRQDVQYKGKSKVPPRQRKQGRSHFNAKLREVQLLPVVMHVFCCWKS